MRLERGDHRGDLGKVRRRIGCAQTHILEHPRDLAAGKRPAVLKLLPKGFCAAAAAGEAAAPSQYLVRPGAPAIGPASVGRGKTLREVVLVDEVLGLHLAGGVDDLAGSVGGG